MRRALEGWQRRELLEDARLGVSHEALAERYGITVAAVRKAVQRDRKAVRSEDPDR